MHYIIRIAFLVENEEQVDDVFCLMLIDINVLDEIGREGSNHQSTKAGEQQLLKSCLSFRLPSFKFAVIGAVIYLCVIWMACKVTIRGTVDLV
jgi:hypothetical protein